MKKIALAAALLGAGFLISTAATAQEAPQVNIGQRHGNLRHAQENIVAAYQYIGDAQSSNEDQLGGHAARAKELLKQADHELRLAANAANAHD